MRLVGRAAELNKRFRVLLASKSPRRREILQQLVRCHAKLPRLHHLPACHFLAATPSSHHSSLPQLHTQGVEFEVVPSGFDETSLDKAAYPTPAAFVEDNAR